MDGAIPMTRVQQERKWAATVDNPLAKIILGALTNPRIATETFPQVDGGLPLAPWSGSFASTPFPADAAGNPLYDRVEFAGEAGLYEALDTAPQLEVLWSGALAWQGQGIDAVARNCETGGYVICEAKGTQSPIAATPLPYLRGTRHKGRQLSWLWCWRSLIDMADYPTTAAAFLCLLEPMLHGRVERLMAVTQVERHGTGFRTLARRIYREAELAQYAPLAAPYDLDRQRRMWAAMPATARPAAATGTHGRVERRAKTCAGSRDNWPPSRLHRSESICTAVNAPHLEQSAHDLGLIVRDDELRAFPRSSS